MLSDDLRPRGLAHRAGPSRPPPDLARAVRRWVTVMTIGFLVGLTLLFWAVTGNVVAGLAIGGFGALWGGPGFGVMAGSAVHAMRTEHDGRR
jgi:hypothetical protein